MALKSITLFVGLSVTRRQIRKIRIAAKNDEKPIINPFV
tara:strand:- start:617 stop:733 length:117 start_codon:yes stop_codon:yes gene_type:complete